MKQYLYILAALLLVVTSLIAAEKTPRTLTVTGTAEVTVKPDICYMNFSINTENVKKAIEAYQMNNEISEKVRSAVKSAGIEDKDIQTTNYSIAPQYRLDDKTKKRIFEGYTVNHTLSVSVRNLDKVSNILDAAVNSGANEVSGINFTIENPKKYTAGIRVDAIKVARAKAEIITKETDVKLLKPISIYEAEPGNWPGYFAQSNVSVDQIQTAETEVPLEPGQAKLTHTVTIIYEIE
jgi:uncharacterized protein